MDSKNNLIANILGIFNKLTTRNKITLISVVGGVFLLFMVFLFVFNEPNYGILFSNLSQEDASKVIEELNSQKIPYKIDEKSSAIKVPKDKVYELRLSLAGKGVPNSGIIGYEIFDKTTMGMSEFLQQLNYRRALEGELSRTIGQIENVDAARVHIVIPKKSVFKEDEKEPTASVILKLKGTSGLRENRILAIANLVSSSVEGLVPENVTILDSKGKLLSKNEKENTQASISSKQYEIKQSIESYLAQKAQTIMDNVIGTGNSLVQVSADLNFDMVEKTMEVYDPESQVAISQQSIRSDVGQKKLGDTSSQVNENLTTNYEVSKTIQKVVEGTGNIKRLSVAAVINGTTRTVQNGEKTEKVYVPRTADQMQKMEEIIKKAVGFDATRQDQVSIENIAFEQPIEEEETTKSAGPLGDFGDWKNLVVILIALGAAIVVLKSLMGKLKSEKIVLGSYPNTYLETSPDYADSYIGQQPQLTNGNITGTQALPGSGAKLNLPLEKRKNLMPVGNIEDEITDEAIMKKAKQEKIVNYVAKNPAEAAKLINTWLMEDEDNG